MRRGNPEYEPDDRGRWTAMADDPDHVKYDATDNLRTCFTLICKKCASKRVVLGRFTFSSPEEFAIRELADIVIELTAASAKLVEHPLPADDPSQRQPDITLARHRLGWQPTVPLREGLAKTIDWFRSIDMTEYRPPTPNY